jgi:hypothetical protein
MAPDAPTQLVVEAGGQATFVDEHHDGLDALGLEQGHLGVDGLHLVEEGQPLDPRGHGHRRGAFQGEADEATAPPRTAGRS